MFRENVDERQKNPPNSETAHAPAEGPIRWQVIRERRRSRMGPPKSLEFRSFARVASADAALSDWLVNGDLGTGIPTLAVVARHRRGSRYASCFNCVGLRLVFD
jgi:hypothetical protein